MDSFEKAQKAFEFMSNQLSEKCVNRRDMAIMAHKILLAMWELMWWCIVLTSTTVKRADQALETTKAWASGILLNLIKREWCAEREGIGVMPRVIMDSQGNVIRENSTTAEGRLVVKRRGRTLGKQLGRPRKNRKAEPLEETEDSKLSDSVSDESRQNGTTRPLAMNCRRSPRLNTSKSARPSSRERLPRIAKGD